MKVTVKMRVSKKLAIMENKDAAGDVILEIETKDLTDEEREELLEMGNYNDHYKLYDGNYPSQWCYDIAEATVEQVKIFLHRHRKYRLEKEAERKADAETTNHENLQKIRKWMNEPDKWVKDAEVRIRMNWPQISTYRLSKGLKDYLAEMPDFKEAYDDAKSLEFWLDLEMAIKDIKDKKANRERWAKRKAEEESDRLKKKEQIATWVAEKGTESQKARLTEDLLPEKEIVDEIRNDAYRPLDGYDRYEKITTSDVCDCEYGYCDVVFDVKDKHEATEDEFDLMQEFKKFMPDATVTLREHKGESEDCENTFTSVGVMVKIKVGGFNFSREYAA